MELRQVVTVAVFMAAAVIMKSTISDQLNPMGSELTITEISKQNSESPQILAALPLGLVSQTPVNLFVSGVAEFESSTKNDTQVSSIPGSVVAIVVAVLGLVSVARRTSVE